jgi:hypothetical protein
MPAHKAEHLKHPVLGLYFSNLMLEVQIEYKSYIIHTAHFQILVMCTNYAIIMVTYNKKKRNRQYSEL